MIKETKLLFTVLLLIFYNIGISQESSIYESYYFSPFLINPAITGSETYPVADISLKKQWVGFPDAPFTAQVSGNYRIGKYDFYDPKGFVNKGPLNLVERFGLGAALYHDTNGPLAFTGCFVSGAYHLPLNSKTNLSFGLALSGSYYTFDNSILNPDQPNDNYLINENENKFKFNLNLGSYYFSNYYFIGLSANNIFPDISNVNGKESNKPSFFLVGGYKFMENNKSFNFEPSMVFKRIKDEPFAIDFHSKLYIRKLNWIAVSYSTTSNISFQFGINLYRMLYFGYKYSYSIGKIAQYNYGSHEIHLGINMGLFAVKGIHNVK